VARYALRNDAGGDIHNLGFADWADWDRRGRLVIARDSGEATLWPALPVGEVIRRYEEEYGVDGGEGEQQGRNRGTKSHRQLPSM